MFPQARAVWRWSNYLQSICPCDRTLVLLNIDETSVKLVPRESKGHVSDRAYRLHIRGIPMGRNASLSAQRSCITHMGAVSDQPAVQRLLPQVILVGENQVSVARYDAIRRSAPAGVDIWRLPKAWMNATLMTRYLRLLGTRLRGLKETHRFILYMDAHRVHCTPAVLRCASAVDLWICVIPSKMTWVMQPCDTHLFSSYKRQLGEELQQLSGETVDGTLNWELVLEALWRVVASLLTDRDWSYAFAAVGLADQQQRLSKRTRNKLQYTEDNLEVLHSLPLLEDFVHIFPRRTDPPLHELFLPVERFLRGQSLPPVDVVDGIDHGETPAITVNPWYGRTRSTSTQALQASPGLPTPWPRSPVSQEMQPPPPPPMEEPPPNTSTASSSSACMTMPASAMIPRGRPLPPPVRALSRAQSSHALPAPPQQPPS